MSLLSQSARLCRLWCFGLVSLLSLALSQPVLAVGLGELHSTSVLGEPLKATIELVGAGGLTLEEVKAKIVSADEAERLGVSVVGGNFYQVRLQPEWSNGALRIVMTSSGPIREPFVNLLVELLWPDGRVVREYVLLLDPPTAITPAVTTESSDNYVTKPAPRASRIVPTHAAVQPKQSFSSVLGQQYKVKSGDTLSGIASNIGRGLNRKRSDIADWLLANNPSAFIRNNPNLLRAGSVLTLPDNASLASFSKPAPATVRSSLPAPQPAPAVSQTPVSTPSNTEPAVAIEQAELSIVSTDTANSTGLRNMRNELAATRELIDSLNRENQELRRRIENLEKAGIEASIEQLLILKDQEIASLSQEIKQLKANNAMAAVPDPEDKTIAGIGTKPVLPEPQPEQRQNSNLNSPWTYLLLLLIALLVGATVILLRKYSKAEETRLTATDAMSTRWRPDDEVKQGIAAKTQGYEPQEAEELVQFDVNEIIAEALSLADAGSFDLAEAIVVSAMVETGGDEKLDKTLQHIEELRKKNSDVWQ